MGKYISIGNFEQKYLIYILIYFIGLFCISNGLCSFTTIQKFRIFYTPHSHILMENILKNIMLTLFIIPEFILNYIFKTENKKTKKIKLTPKKIMHIIICSICYLLNHISEKMLLYKPDLCYFHGPRLLISFIFSKYVFKNKYYRHQYFSLIIILALLITSNTCEIYWTHNWFQKYPTSGFIVGFITSLMFGTFQFISEVCYSKIFIEEYLFSPFKICYFFGFINTIVGIIVYIIVSYISSHYEYLQFVYYKNKYYFDNYKEFIENFYSPGFFYGLLYSLLEIIFIFVVNLIVQKYTLSHIYFIFVISIFILQIQVARENLKINKKFKYLIIIIVICFILEIFLNFIILEFIELNFCSLNINLKKYIAKRAKEDIIVQLDEEVEEQKIYDDENYVTELSEANILKKIKDNYTTIL